MLKDVLVHDHEVAVQAGVDLQVLRSLHEDGAEKLVVERIDGEAGINEIIMVAADVLRPDFLGCVGDETVSVDPDELRIDRQDSMAELLIFARRRYRLQGLDGANVPNDELVALIEGENEGATLDNVDAYDGLAVARESA